MVQPHVMWDTYKGNSRQCEISASRNCRKREEHDQHQKINQLPKKPNRNWNKTTTLPSSCFYCFPLALQWTHLCGKDHLLLAVGAVKGLQQSRDRNPHGKLRISNSSKLSSLGSNRKHSSSGVPGRSSRATSSLKKIPKLLPKQLQNANFFCKLTFPMCTWEMEINMNKSK